MKYLFVQTGATPPRGHISTVRVVKPSAKDANKDNKTLLVVDNPYRRVYKDGEGMYVNYFGKKCRAFLAGFNNSRGEL